MRRGDHRRHVLRLRGPLLRLKEVVTDGAADDALPVLLQEDVPRGVDQEQAVDHGCGGAALRRSETPESAPRTGRAPRARSGAAANPAHRAKKPRPPRGETPPTALAEPLPWGRPPAPAPRAPHPGSGRTGIQPATRSRPAEPRAPAVPVCRVCPASDAVSRRDKAGTDAGSPRQAAPSALGAVPRGAAARSGRCSLPARSSPAQRGPFPRGELESSS